MNTLVIVLAVILVFAGVVFRQRGFPEEKSQPTPTPKVLSQIEEEESQATPTPTPTPAQTPKTLAPTPAPQTSGEISAFVYPGARVESSSATSLSMKSSDDTDRITQWYEDKIRGMGMNAKSFVKTRTNDNVLNKLVGADGEREIRVEISQKSGESEASISVTIEVD